MSKVTRILSAIEEGDPHAAEQLLPLVYDELRRLAAQKLAQEYLFSGSNVMKTVVSHCEQLHLLSPKKRILNHAEV
jgi:hypothetical protein